MKREGSLRGKMEERGFTQMLLPLPVSSVACHHRMIQKGASLVSVQAGYPVLVTLIR